MKDLSQYSSRELHLIAAARREVAEHRKKAGELIEDLVSRGETARSQTIEAKKYQIEASMLLDAAHICLALAQKKARAAA